MENGSGAQLVAAALSRLEVQTLLLRHLPLVTAISLSLVACSPSTPVPTRAAELTHVRLPMGYIPNVQYAPLYVAAERGYFADQGIAVDFDYSTETDGVALLGAGDVRFSLASGEQVLLARAQGLPVVYVFGWWQDYPVAVAARASSGITRPQDLAGKRIGLPGTFGASYIGLRALLDAAGLSESDVTLDSIGFNQVQALVANQEQAVVVYANNEPIQLEAQGVAVNVIRVADYVHLASNGLVSNETTIRDNPDLVRGMARAFQMGIGDTLENPQAAYEICKKYVENLAQADQAVQMAVLEASLDFWRADRIGYSEPQAWTNMQSVLLEMGLLSEPLPLDQAFTNDFVPSP
jgi:NitT/TauT family transport system substrate-binding protein